MVADVHEPIAVVAVSCRLPGATGPEQFWQLLREGGSAITGVPAGRWTDAPVRVRRGGFLDDVAGFDAGFFGVTPREAAAMDPQQRLALELGWEALADAGDVRGRAVGVFLGVIADDYARLTERAGADAVNPHTLAGLNRGLLANRLSYLFGLRGVSLTVDTGQSSSLVAVHLACASLRSGESELALAGGVQLNLTGSATVAAERFGALSPDGECWTFDARANGYVRGEGGAVVLLKTLSRARADGDDVWAVILGSAVNNDGGGAALTTPDPDAQREVIAAAGRSAGIAPADVQYVELHGTGTRVGDPIEARALGAALGAGRAAGRPLLVGSAKTNVGHLEGAAGITGLVKVVLALRARELPPNRNYAHPNPDIALDEWRLRVVDRLGPWPRPTEPLIAGVSSFGMGGTNCHLVLTAADAADPVVSSQDGLVRPYALSAPDEPGLRAQATRLAGWLREHPGTPDAGLARSLLRRRSLDRRAVVVADGRETLLSRLDAVGAGDPAVGVVDGTAGPGLVAVLFTGQGAQRLGMGRDLYAARPAFAAAFDEVCAHLDADLDPPLREVIWGAEGSPIDDTGYAQPGLFAVEVALYRLVTSFGVRPALLLGHSIGELAAAHVSGVLSLPDAARLVVARGRLMRALPPGGAMAAIEASEDEVRESLGTLAVRAGIAAVNGPRAVVVSGDADAVEELTTRWKAAGRRTRRLRVSHAFHSPRMDPMLDDFRAVARSVTYGAPSVPIVSDLTGEIATAAHLADPEYWVRHVREAVRFGDGVTRLVTAGVGTFLELGPDAVLAPMARASAEGRFVSTMRADRPEDLTFVEAMAALHVAGSDVDLGTVAGNGPRVALPAYAFQRRRHWLTETEAAMLPVADKPVAPTEEPAAPAEDPAVPAEEPAVPAQEPAAPVADVLTVIRRHTAVVLGLDGPADVPPETSFRDLGLTSATGVELRDRLAAVLERALPETLVYDHPSPAELAGHLAGGEPEPGPGEPVAVDGDPVVIVGMACRFPGGVTGPDELWRVVADGVDAIGDFPADRGWDVSRLYDPDPDRRGSSYVREGGFLPGVAEFDAAFFGISPREAAALDPQQRMLLETAWESIERAGIDPLSLRGSDTGVFVGATFQEYGPRLGEPSDGSEGYQFTGTTPSVASGRIAYFLGLHGPALTIDTACSASLVALHTAAAALRSGECSLALAGGVTVMSTPGVFAELSRLGGLSPTGRSRAFGAGADGTGWAEGAGTLVLERLSDATRHGHPVLAVIRGSAVNSDGASNGLTAPNGAAQRRVVRQALAAAGLRPSEVDAVEAHGTGTRLGDPIEAGALLSTYGADRADPLWLGSIKSNIGHTQAAAGVAGVIKMVLALRHGTLPRTLHADEPTPRVDWSSGSVRLLTEPVDWPARPGRPRRAGVSSFGISGTNAHLILEESPILPGATAPMPEAPEVPVSWPLSAKNPQALRAQAELLAAHLDAAPADVAWSLLQTRSAFGHRAVVPGGHREALAAVATGRPHPEAVVGTVTDPGATAFVFPGHGSQWPGMVTDLYDNEPAFAARLRECAAAIDPLIDWSLLDTALGREGSADQERTDVAQPVLFAVMVSLAALWQAYGVVPAAVVGHSQGELAAACVAGILTLPDAATVVVRRSRLYAEELPGRGMMAAIELSAAGVRTRIADRDARLDVAVVNGPLAVTVAGEPDEVERFVAGCKADGIRARIVVRAGASHCSLVEPLREPLRVALDGIAHHPARIPFYSSVTGGRLDDVDAGYWFRNVREPVDFQSAITALLADGHGTFLECSPHPLLIPALLDTAEAAGLQPVALGTLHRNAGGRFRRSLAEAWVRGVPVDLGVPGGRRVELPTYPFQRRRHWLTAGTGPADVEAAGLTATGHPLLGAVLTAVDGEQIVLTGRVSAGNPAWVAGHAAGGTPLLPGTAFAELALRAGDEAGCGRLEELTVERPLLLHRPVQLRVTVGAPGTDGGRPVRIHSRPDDGPWTRHAAGILSASAAPVVTLSAEWPPSGAEPVDVSTFYADRAADGYGYGPGFQGLRAAWRSGTDLYAEVALDLDDAGDYAIHPALLDAVLHAELLRTPGIPGHLRLPFAFTGLTVPVTSATSLRVHVTTAGGEAVTVTAFDETGRAVAVIDSLLFRPVPVTGLTNGPTDGGALYGVDWQPVPDAPAADVEVALLLPAPIGTVLAELQADRPQRLVVVADPADGTVRGLVRSAQAEHPGRFLLLESTNADEARIRHAAARLIAAGEDQGALRDGDLLTPRLVPVAGGPRPELDPDATILITGGTGTLGRDLARHLVAGGARRLLLVGRRGPEAPGAAELRDELTAAGAQAEIAAADVADRDALAAVLAGHRLTAVFHLAAAVDDGPLETMTPQRLAAVLRPKVDGARHLDELTRDHDLAAFVLFSSAVGVLGTPAQSAYAAANTALDALAGRRRAAGLPALSLAWGLWNLDSGLGRLDERDLTRLRRSGLAPMSAPDGWALLDAALGSDRALLIPARLDLADVRRDPPPLFRRLVRAPARAAAAAPPVEGARLAALSRADQERELLDLIRTHAAVALGHDPSEAAAIRPDRAFRESGFDSLTVVELRNSLKAATGLPLPATLLFDHPTPAALAAHLRSRLAGETATAPAAAPRGAAGDPIAIVAMACRFPGGVTGPEDLWRMVDAGDEAIGDFPDDRGWDLERLFDPDPARPGRSATRRGGFLHDAGDFDAALFGISPREALAMDPQQRLLLETCWETWENAGIPLAEVRESNTGVFLGVAYHDYAARADQLPDGVEGYLMTGSAGSVASGRIAYAFGLHGPAITVDTACSSSLVALHLAVRALRAGECDLALAGGVSVMATPTTFVEFSRQQGLAGDGRCKSYGEDADGTGWSEGVGVLLVERLSDARRLGHDVLGLVQGTAINQDGASNGLTAPSGPAQERVIRAAWADAGLRGSEVDVIEGHGTGTRLGDPIEAQALLATYGQDRGELPPAWLGSLKSNIGHTQAAAGVAGIIKTLQSFRYERLPRTLHADVPTSQVDWAAGAVRLLHEARPWPRTPERPRRAGVSSFGISGTNAHVILAEPPAAEPAPDRPGDPSRVLPLAVSAGSPESLRRLIDRLPSGPDLLDVAYTLATARTPLPYRAALTTATPAVIGPVPVEEPHRLAFVFSGQGAQWPGMGQGLDFVPAGDLDRTEFAQPALFGFEVALYRQLEKWGVRPSVLAGHSVGEIAAAHVAGVFSYEDALTLVRARGRLMQALPEGGVMVAVEAPEEVVRPLLRDGVDLAAINGPNAVVISGPSAAVDAVLTELEGRRRKRLRVSHAFHSSLMEPMLADFRKVVEGLTLRDPEVPLISGLTGSLVMPGEMSDPEYWVRHVREPVRFGDAVAAARADLFVEVGPDAVLAPMITETPVVALPRRDGDEPALLAARLFAAGVTLDWPEYFDGTGARRTALPNYAFDHRFYWLADGAAPSVLAPEPVHRQSLDDADLLDLVCEQTAAVLGHGDPAAVDPDRPFRDIGFDSLTAVELRNRLGRISGLQLSATLVFDHPTPAAVADHLRGELRPADADPSLDELFALVDSELGPEAS